MRIFSIDVTTVLQGLYSLCWIVILLDVASPAFELSVPRAGSGATLWVAAGVTLAAAAVIGVVMHTLSRNLFRRQKDLWGVHDPHQLRLAAPLRGARRG